PIPARADDQMAQRSERFRLYRLRARQRTWTAEVLNAQDIKQQRTILIRVHPGLFQGGVQLCGYCVDRVHLGDPADATQQIEYQLVWHHRPIGEAASLNPDDCLGHALAELVDEPRLADPGLTDEADHPAAPLTDR